MRGRHLAGHSRTPGQINLGGNSGYQAVELAVQFGATRVVLLGYDMGMTGGRHHWHGKHPAPLGNGTMFDKWCARFDVLARDLRGIGVDVVNCSRATALRAFPRMALEDALT